LLRKTSKGGGGVRGRGVRQSSIKTESIGNKKTIKPTSKVELQGKQMQYIKGVK
tara:strand:+ start:282 stop:443 length:162 start_codon:yes stop_codon:yes gene_type:complete